MLFTKNLLQTYRQ
ncbi:hypothetical protein YPPY16_3892, partial [Yersinia pestis PY-16]